MRFDNERSVWLIGVQAFRVGSAFVRSRDLVTIARPYMRRLMEQSGETVNLGIADRGEIVYLAQVECQKMMRAIAGPGGRARMHCSGVGKAILCAHERRPIRKVLHGRELTRETSTPTLTSKPCSRILKSRNSAAMRLMMRKTPSACAAWHLRCSMSMANPWGDFGVRSVCACHRPARVRFWVNLVTPDCQRHHRRTGRYRATADGRARQAKPDFSRSKEFYGQKKKQAAATTGRVSFRG